MSDGCINLFFTSLLVTSSLAVFDPVSEIKPMAVEYGRDITIKINDEIKKAKSLMVHREASHVMATGRKSERASKGDVECVCTFIVPKPFQQCTQEQSNHHELDTLHAAATHLNEPQPSTNIIANLVKKVTRKVRKMEKRLSSISSVEETVTSLVERASNTSDEMRRLKEEFHQKVNSIEMMVEIMKQMMQYNELLEKHTRLQKAHNVLRKQVESQSKILSELRHLPGRTSPQKEEKLPTQPSNLTEERNASSGRFRDCSHAQEAGYRRSGVVPIYISGYARKILVWCDFKQDPGGWTVIQRRSRKMKFNRNMAAYKRGFGNPHSDYWLGLETIYLLTNQPGSGYKLHIQLEDWTGAERFAEYGSFKIGAEMSGYKLYTSHYRGNAGDSLTWHNKMAFSSPDVDNDHSKRSCAQVHKAGWWFKDCARSSLNGIYHRGYSRSTNQDGIFWETWKGSNYSLKKVIMKIRPIK